jgi:hypothetical protein
LLRVLLLYVVSSGDFDLKCTKMQIIIYVFNRSTTSIRFAKINQLDRMDFDIRLS